MNESVNFNHKLETIISFFVIVAFIIFPLQAQGQNVDSLVDVMNLPTNWRRLIMRRNIFHGVSQKLI